MRRIVFDCDRCGRHDIGDPYSRYTKDGESEEHLLDETGRRALIEECGFAYEDLGAFVFANIEWLERDRGYVHLCRKCFHQSVDWFAKICQVKPNAALKARTKARKKEETANVPRKAPATGARRAAVRAVPAEQRAVAAS